tara:strand:+ start:203 stop:370 length:168 start_codon:yes stop_codon:yes gene_type:complete
MKKQKKKIIQNIVNKKDDKTIIIVSHNKSNLSFCDQNYEIEDGKITILNKNLKKL